jgi:DNA-binding response OmpR family regulator
MDLPGGEGLAALRRLRLTDHALPVLALTAPRLWQERVQALDLGADDCLVQPFVVEELAARVRALIRRSRAPFCRSRTHGPLVVDPLARRSYLFGQPLDLTGREWAVLQVLVGKTGSIVSKESLIEALADADDELSLNAVEAYVSRLRAKLKDGPVQIRTIRGLGYMLEQFKCQPPAF